MLYCIMTHEARIFTFRAILDEQLCSTTRCMVLGAIHKQVCVTLNVKLTFRGGGGGLACDVMTTVYWYSLFVGAIKPRV